MADSFAFALRTAGRVQSLLFDYAHYAREGRLVTADYFATEGKGGLLLLSGR